ncbi:MAG: type II toxin-antitoxin system HicA family toxin [Candidatus Omnitrophica bacterium]|nr:type II toxin-antitoxin system HicA family toxin [Candidatus Omnitrophota bacterium]
MSKIEKLFEKILSSPKEVRFSELQKVLLELGYSSRPGKGSHTVFCHPDFHPIVVPHRSPVKKVYVEQVRELLRSYLEKTKEAK